jgi:hypothetical protein
MSKKLTKAEKAKFFNVSLTTLANWSRGGAPLDADLGAIMEWKAGRDLTRAGIGAAFPRLPGLVGELTRRIAALNERIEEVNAWPPGTEKKPNLLKVALLCGMRLEAALLDLPMTIVAEAKPGSLPEDVHRIVLAALDEVKNPICEEEV